MAASEGERIALERIAKEADERTGFLDLGLLGLTELPAELFALKHLQGLNLGYRWTDISGEPQRAEAYLGANQIASSLEKLGDLSDLRELSLSGVGLNDLRRLAGLKRLHLINCSSTQVSDLTPLASLLALQSIDCSSTPVTDLAPLTAIPALQEFHCDYTQVTDLAPITRLQALQSISFRSTRVSDLAPLASLKKLEAIDCLNTRVNDLTPVAGLRALQSIDCSLTEVTDLAPLADLKRLQSVDCSSTQVDDLVPLAGLKALKSIDCSSTQVDDLAPLTGLPALQSVRCAWTRVNNLAPLATLRALRSLTCYNTRVHELAPLADLPDLESIDCSRTEVCDLDAIADLCALRWIDCSFTQVRTLMPLANAASLLKVTCNGLILEDSSAPYLNLPSLREFACWKTRIFGVPAEVLSQGYDHNCLPELRAHFQDLADGAVESRDVKLMVLGNGRVGKTQLCRRFQGLTYHDAVPSTHGIVVESFDLPRGGRTDFARVHIWDFGGQDIYHGVHALFLRANAVFILVWAPEFESGEQTHRALTFRNYPLRYWVDYVRQLGGMDAAVLIVQARCDSARDRRACPVHDDDLREAFGGGYCEVIQFSALNDRGLAGLKEKLGEAIEFVRESEGIVRIGASRQRVKTRLETLRDEDAKLPQDQRRSRWLAQDEFHRICVEERLVSEPEFLLDYLHDSGVVFYRKGLFEDRIVLDQSWALEAIYAVFNRDSCLRQLRRLRGRFTRSLLEALVWTGRSVGEQKLLIDMMESCGICFQLREEDESAGIEPEYIAPDLLPERAVLQTELDGFWGREGSAEHATYEFDLLLPALLRALTSRIGHRAGVSALYWRDGLCVYEASTGAHALIEQTMDAGWRGRLILSTRGGRAHELLERLKEWVEEGQNHLGLQAKKREDERTMEFARREPFRDGAEKPPEMRFAAAPRSTPRWYVSYAWNDPSDPQRERDVDRTCAAAETSGTPIIRDKTAMAAGDSISRFMKEISQGDRVFVFLSDKYLKSPFCMFELFEIWRSSRLDKEEFRKKVRLYRLPDATIFSPKERLGYAKYWRAQHEELAAELKSTDPSLLGESDFRAFRLMQGFAHYVGDILALFADTLLPRTFEDFLKLGFDEQPPQ